MYNRFIKIYLQMSNGGISLEAANANKYHGRAGRRREEKGGEGRRREEKGGEGSGRRTYCVTQSDVCLDYLIN
jgi:hypothetical protein